MKKDRKNQKEEENPREFFGNLLDRLSPAAKNCDVGFYVKRCQGVFVNNYKQGRILTIKERVDYLKGKMLEKRRETNLASLFPADWLIIQSL